MVLAESVNVARRLTSKVENDLVQEDMVEMKKSYSECKAIASKLGSVKELPNACFDYKDIVISLAKRPTKAQSDHATAFEGMGSSAAAAAKARAGGRESYAQIQRRYTNTRRFTKDN